MYIFLKSPVDKMGQRMVACMRQMRVARPPGGPVGVDWAWHGHTHCVVDTQKTLLHNTETANTTTRNPPHPPTSSPQVSPGKGKAEAFLF